MGEGLRVGLRRGEERGGGLQFGREVEFGGICGIAGGFEWNLVECQEIRGYAGQSEPEERVGGAWSGRFGKGHLKA